jgi:hypothetical protein
MHGVGGVTRDTHGFYRTVVGRGKQSDYSILYILYNVAIIYTKVATVTTAATFSVTVTTMTGAVPSCGRAWQRHNRK